jgi:hypothetical protein
MFEEYDTMSMAQLRKACKALGKKTCRKKFDLIKIIKTQLILNEIEKGLVQLEQLN